MPSSFNSIPIIDISKLYSPDFNERLSVAKQIGIIAHDIGFMYITGHKVPKEAIAGVKSAAKEFFSLPMEDKMNVYIGKSNCHKGYVPEGEEVFDESDVPDHKEAFDIGREYDLESPMVKAKLPLIGLNQWPREDQLPNFRKRVTTYFDEVVNLSKVLLHGFSLALGQEEDALDQFFTDPIPIMRLVHYPYDDQAKKKGTQGIGEHTDYECFTILLADSPGLEVVNGNNEWIAAPPIEGAFVINFGDLLEVMTNKQVTATAHRVKKVKQERYSFPMFISPNYHTEIKPFPQFTTSTAPSFDKSKYSSVISGDHIWASLIQTHRYLLNKINNGELQYPSNSTPRGTYGPDALAPHTL